MAHGEFVADSGSYSKYGVFLADDLPSFMPNDPQSGNYRLLDVIGRIFDRAEDDTRNVSEAVHVQTANTIGELKKLGSFVNLHAGTGESKEKFRSRLLAEHQLITCEGTVNNILTNAATILNVNVRDVGWNENIAENGAEVLEVPKSALEALELTENEFVEILSKQVPIGYRLTAQFSGTFEYISSADYDAGLSDPAKGYSDEADTIQGGTYAGLLQ